MQNVLCFISADMADFEVTLALQILKNIGQRAVIPVGYDLTPVVSQSGFTHLPQLSLEQAMELKDVEALIIPGGPIRPQGAELTRLLQQLDRERKLLAAICFGPQYLGRAGVLDIRRFTTSCAEETIHSLGVSDPYPRQNYVEARMVRDGHVITAKGSAFVDFAFAIADCLGVYVDKPGEMEAFYADIVNKHKQESGIGR
jgi:putative intracellular protease/amidase